MRPIDADELKTRVPNTSADIFENCRNCNLLDDWQVKEMIDNAPTVEPASPWHRVEEPPKVSCKVIAYAVSNSTGERDVTTAYYKQRSSRFHITGRRSHWRVTHWMPIEPPKEDA